MRIIILLIVFYFPCWVFAGGPPCLPFPACLGGGGGGSSSPVLYPLIYLMQARYNAPITCKQVR